MCGETQIFHEAAVAELATAVNGYGSVYQQSYSFLAKVILLYSFKLWDTAPYSRRHKLSTNLIIKIFFLNKLLIKTLEAINHKSNKFNSTVEQLKLILYCIYSHLWFYWLKYLSWIISCTYDSFQKHFNSEIFWAFIVKYILSEWTD